MRRTANIPPPYCQEHLPPALPEFFHQSCNFRPTLDKLVPLLLPTLTLHPVRVSSLLLLPGFRTRIAPPTTVSKKHAHETYKQQVPASATFPPRHAMHSVLLHNATATLSSVTITIFFIRCPPTPSEYPAAYASIPLLPLPSNSCATSICL